MIIGNDQWVIDEQSKPKNFVAYRLLIDDITHWCNWLLIDCYTARKKLFLLSCTICFSFVIVLSVLDAFFLVYEVPVDDLETQSANHQLCNLQNWTILTRQPSSVVQQKPKFHGKWFFHFKILENLLKLNLETSVYIYAVFHHQIRLQPRDDIDE